MQQFKANFKDKSVIGTLSNVQSCLRLNDIEEIGDGTHLLCFDMMGLFSFREMSVKNAIDFWFDFLEEINVIPDTITIHPDRFEEWKSFYENRNVLVTLDSECIWSDGEIGGYCTEFYKDGIEIGNIVNTNGDCIDVGFGLDRLLIFLGEPSLTEIEVLQQGIMKMIHSGFTPGHKGQGYILKKLLRELVNKNGQLDHPIFTKELERQERLKRNFKRLWPKHSEKSSEWWMDTHGIDLKEFNDIIIEEKGEKYD